MKTAFTLICFSLGILGVIVLFPDAIPPNQRETLQIMDKTYISAHVRAVHDIACSSGRQCSTCHHPKQRRLHKR